MNKKHKRVLDPIFKTPVQSNVVWKDIEKLFEYLGARIKEGEGSRLAVELYHTRVGLAIFLRAKALAVERSKVTQYYNMGSLSIVQTRGFGATKKSLILPACGINGVRAYFHRPHPQKETDKCALVSVRKFLDNAGVKPC